METEEVIKLVDNIYKNILDKFNPGARQLISAGKAYLKALHGTSAASRVFNEALAKIAVNAQQGGTNDIGSALMNIVGVYKDIQDQHMNILKAFYVDLLVPLETNLEKDTKVVQFEQKRFMQQHKIRSDSYSKATATMKKQRKKKGNAQNADKEIKSIQAVDEEKNKLDAFCEQSLKNAMTQERRRYGFVLERQCSLAKHWIAYHSAGKNYILNNLDNWEEVSASREFLPPNMENVFARQMIVDMHNENDMDDDSDRGSVISALRKTRSIDASCLDMRSIGDVVANGASSRMPRAKSEFNLTSSSSTIIDAPKWDKRTVSRGLYAYLSSGENQLSFLEGDRIALVGDRAKGWQFGENLRTHSFGWFPVAYTELEQEDNHNNWGSSRNGQTELLGQHHSQQQLQQQQQQSTQQQSIQAQPQHHQQQPKQKHHQTSASSHGAQQRSSDHQLTPDSSLESTVMDEPLLPAQVQHAYNEDASTQRMFGDTIMYRQSKHSRRVSGGIATGTAGQQQQQPKPGPPPTLPAPVPQPTVPGSGGSYPSSSSASSHSQISQMSQSQKFMANGGDGGGASMSNVEKRKSMPAGANYGKQQQVNAVSKPKARNSVAVNNASLHSSNDSGFANELAPPQPDVDYSDDDTVTRVPIRSHPVTRSPSNVHAVAASNKKSSRIPTRRQNERDPLPTPAKSTTSGVSHSKSSSTLMRPSKSAKNSGEMRPSTSYGNLTSEELLQQQQQDADFVYRTIDRKANGNIIKRTKSFWKFGKGDDILEGMAMWRHRDLVPADGELDDDADDEVQPVAETATLRRQQQQRTATVAPAALSGQQQKSSTLSSAHSTETLTNVASSGVEMHEMGEYLVKNGMVIDGNVGNKYHFTKSEIDSRISAMQTTMQQQQQQQHQQHDRQQQPQPQQQQQQQHSGNKHRESVAYETAPEEEDESIYDVQPKTRQMANMNVMSRDKVIRQAYLESEREMQENNAQQQAAYQQDKQYRSSRTEKLAAYNGGQQQQHSSQKQQTQQQPPATAAATSTTKKKKTKNQSKQPMPVAQPQPPIEYYQRAETPDTIHHDDAVFDDEDIMNDNAVRVRDTDFYDDESADDVAIMMKTVKRQDILKQYYNSSDGGTDDTEQNSTSSDAYDCIVVEDHHVVRRGQQQQAGGGGAVAGNGGGSHHHQHHDGKTGKMEFKTFRGGNDDKDSGMESSRPGTLLPRTKLSKTNSGGGSGQMSSTGAAQSVQSNGGAKGEKSGGGKRSRTDRTTAERNERAERNDRKDRGDRGAERSTRHEREERRERDNSRNETSHDKYYRSSDIESSPSVKSYGPWYDLWDKDMTVRK